MDNNDCIVMVRGLHPFLTAKFEIINHPRYDMLDEADKENNTYYFEENITTLKETIPIDLSEFYDEGDVDTSELIEIGYITSDNKIVIPPPDLMEDIPDEVRDRLKDVVGVYAIN